MYDDFYKVLRTKAIIYGVINIIMVILTPIFTGLFSGYYYYYYDPYALMSMLPLMFLYLFIAVGMIVVALIFAGSLIKQGNENGLDLMKTSGMLLLFSVLGPFIISFLFGLYIGGSVSFLTTFVQFGLELAGWIVMLVFINQEDGPGVGKGGAIVLIISVSGYIGWNLFPYSLGTTDIFIGIGLGVLQSIGLFLLGGGFGQMEEGGSPAAETTSYGGGGYQSYLQQRSSDELSFDVSSSSPPAQSSPGQRTCPSCGAPIDISGPDVVFCPNCGARL